MADQPSRYPGYRVTASQESATGVKTINRDIEPDAHPILTSEMFLNCAKARLEAAKVLNQQSKKSDAEKQSAAADLEKMSQGLLVSFFEVSAYKLEESAFEKAKKIYREQKNEIYFILEQAVTVRGDGTDPKRLAQAIDLEKDAQARLQAAEQEFNDAFDDFYNIRMTRLKQVNRLLVHYVDPKSVKDKQIKSVMKKINAKADDLRALQARPIQNNHYRALHLAVTSSHSPEGQLNTLQKVLYQEVHGKSAPENHPHTGPSTIRDRRQIGQCNAIRTDIRVEGKIVFSGHRHGSPSVLKINNEAERQYRTMQNVRQTLAIAAKEKIEQLGREKESLEKMPQPLNNLNKKRLENISDVLSGKIPLPLDMASMSLLSPLIDDNPFVHPKADDPMKQYRQVNDSRLAYWSLQGREIELDVPGSTPIKIKLNSTFMNVGVNAGRGVGTLDAQALVQRVNNRGLNNLVDNFVNGLKSEKNASPSVIKTQNLIKTVEKDEKIQKYQQKIKLYDPKKLQKAYASLEKANDGLHYFQNEQQKQKKELSDLNVLIKKRKKLGLKAGTYGESLEKDKANLSAKVDHLNIRIKEDVNKRKKAKKIIEKEEKKLDGYYKNLAIVRKKAYQKTLPELKEKLLLQQEGRTPEELKRDKNFQKMRLFVDTLDTFYNQPQPGLKRLVQQKILSRKKKKILKKLTKEGNPIEKQALSQKAEKIQNEIDGLNQGNYQFQARFALLTQHMDNAIEWFCKSGEDRTGLLNEHIEAYCIFIEKMGYPPRWNNKEDDKLFHEIMPHVHNGAPNRESNAYNDGSPGLKVKDADFVMKSLSYRTDNIIGDIASKSSKSFEGINSVQTIQAAMDLPEPSNQPPITHAFQATQSKGDFRKNPVVTSPSVKNPNKQAKF